MVMVGATTQLILLGSADCDRQGLAAACVQAGASKCSLSPDLKRAMLACARAGLSGEGLESQLRSELSASQPRGVWLIDDPLLALALPGPGGQLPEVRWIWVVQSALTAVSRLHAEGWYAEPDVTDAPAGDRCADVSASRWDAMDPFARCCWYWAYVNRCIDAALQASVNPGRHRLVRSEDLDRERDDLLRWAGMVPVSGLAPLPAPESSDEDWRRWSPAQKRTFLYWCGPMMDRLYPGWWASADGFAEGLQARNALVTVESRGAARDIRIQYTPDDPVPPRVSVVVTSFNQCAWLSEALDSLLAQTRPPDQIVIVDDASTDGSRDLIAGYTRRHPGVMTAVYNEDNLGVVRSRLRGLAEVDGDFVTYLDGDDRVLPGKLEKELCALADSADAHIAFSDYYYIDRGGHRTGRWAEREQPPAGEVFEQVYARDFPRRSLYRNELVFLQAWKAVGYYDPNVSIYEDYESRIRMTRWFHTVYVGEALSEYRMHGDGLSARAAGQHLKSLEYIVNRNRGLTAELPHQARKDIFSDYETWLEGAVLDRVGREETPADCGPQSRWDPEGGNLIFLISMPRSGSTLLQRVLDGHPDVHSLPEPWVMLHPLYALKRDGVDAEYESPLARMALDDFLSYLDGGEEVYIEALRAFAATLYSRALEGSGKRYFLDKTPRYFYAIPELRRVFPRAKFIVLLRNPLAVLSSMLETWCGNDTAALESTGHLPDLARGPELLAGGLRSLGEDAIIVRYEGLVQEPAREVRKLCARLGLAFREDMLDYSGRPGIEGRFGDPVGVARHSRPVADSLARWPMHLRAAPLNEYARGYLRDLGRTLVTDLGYPFDALMGALEDPEAYVAEHAVALPRSRPAASRTFELADYAGALAEEGSALFRLGNPEAACQRFDRALELDPDNAGAAAGRARLHWACGEHERALELWLAVIRSRPRHRDAVMSCALRLKGAGEAAAADRLVTAYLDAVPDDPGLHALREMDAAEARAQTDCVRLNDEGERLYVEGDPDGAFECFLRAYELDPYSVVTRNNLGVLRHRRGDLQAARALLERAAAASDDPGVLLNYAQVLAELGDAPALESLRGTLNALPGSSDITELMNALESQAAKRGADGGPPDDRDYLVSAIVAVYKAERFLQGCLEDLEAQTIADRLEIIVVDTGSPEDEGGIVRAFQHRYNNIRYIRIPERESLYRAWNLGVQAARGKYLTSANADDRHRADGLEMLVDVLESSPDAALAYGDSVRTYIENEGFSNCTPGGYHKFQGFTRARLLQACLGGHQPVWRRSLHDEYGLFDEQYRCAADYDFWLRVARDYDLVHVPCLLGLFWEHQGSVSRRGRDPAEERRSIQARHRDIYERLPPLHLLAPETYGFILRLALEREEMRVLATAPADSALVHELENLPVPRTRLDFVPTLTALAEKGWHDVLVTRELPEMSSPESVLAGAQFRFMVVARHRDAEHWPLEDLGFRPMPAPGVFEWYDRAAVPRRLFQAGHREQACALFERLLDDDPCNADARYHLGLYALDRGEMDRASDELAAAVAEDRRHVFALTALVGLLESAGRVEAAARLSDYTQRIRCPNEPREAAEDAEEFFSPVLPATTEPRVLHVISGRDMDAAERVAEAVAILRARGIDARAVLALDPANAAVESALIDCVEAKGIADHVLVTAVDSHARRLDLYARHNIYVSGPGSTDESAAAERYAMAAGLVMVALAGSAGGTMVQPGRTGVCVTGDDALFLAVEIGRLRADPPAWSRLSGAAQQWARLSYAREASSGNGHAHRAGAA